MFVKKIAVWLVCLALLLPGVVRADVAGAKAAYMRGMAQQKARQYQSAIYEYEASLQAEPRYAYSYKQMGTCYYYMGDKVKAVEAYDKYLAAVPNDPAIRKFTDSLRGQGVVAQPPAFKRFRLTLGSGYSTYGMADYNTYVADSPYPGAGNYTPGTVSGGLPLAMEAQYFINRNIFAGLALGYLMAGGTSKFTYSDSNGTGEQTLVANAPAITFGASGGYAFPNVVKNLSLNLALGIDFVSLSGANFVASSSGTGAYASFFNQPTSTTNISGSGIGAKLSAGADWFFTPGFSIGTSLGYRMAKLSPITATPSSGNNYDLKNQDNSNFSIDYSGIAFTIGTGLWF